MGSKGETRQGAIDLLRVSSGQSWSPRRAVLAAHAATVSKGRTTSIPERAARTAVAPPSALLVYRRFEHAEQVGRSWKPPSWLAEGE